MAIKKYDKLSFSIWYYKSGIKWMFMDERYIRDSVACSIIYSIH